MDTGSIPVTRSLQRVYAPNCMKRIIIVHRWAGGANDDWRPWLKAELETLGYEVLVPAMPDSEVPVIEKWVGHLAEVVGTPDKETFFVGHSIGCQAILRYLDAHLFGPQETVGGAIFVAGWFTMKNFEDEEVKVIAKPWMEGPIDVVKIRTALPKSTLLISDNDPYDAFEENKRRFGELGSKIVVLHGAGHVTAKDGFTRAPVILSELENLLNE
jgi:predicted alpha/beta hydrolase family esterase